MKKLLIAALPLALLATIPNAEAHRAWLVPSSTVLATEDSWVTLDAAVSNEIFHFDYRPMSTENFQVFGPTGSDYPLVNHALGELRGQADLQLSDAGTYKIFTATHALTARWVDADGQRGMYPSRGQRATPEGLQAALPANAQELTVSESSRRIETFVTAGAPSMQALTPSGVGLELQPITHPNDLFAGELAEFQLLIDGEPAVGAEIVIIRAHTRFRDNQEEIELAADDQGHFTITWPQAGLYWLHASYRDDRAKAPATQRVGSYTATFEVLPF